MIGGGAQLRSGRFDAVAAGALCRTLHGRPRGHGPPTRWKLWKAVKVRHQGLVALRLAKHPDKTFIGRIAKGFDFLGYHCGPVGLRVAAKMLTNFVARVH